MILNISIFIVALFMVIKGSTMATKYASALAENFRFSKYTVGFIIVAFISILPETFVAINAALNGIPSFGLGTLLGSNVADLTLIFAVIVWYAGRSIKVDSKILKNQAVYPFVLLLPIILGLNGHLSRIEGIVLILVGSIFYYMAMRSEISFSDILTISKGSNRIKNILLLMLSMLVLIVGAHFVVVSASKLANILNITPILIGLLVVGLGTTMPELFFSLNSVKKDDDSLAIGDMLGTVLADATIAIGIIAVVIPFSFNPRIMYVTGIFMVVTSFVLFRFMKSGRSINKREALILFFLWIIFAIVEFFINT